MAPPERADKRTPLAGLRRKGGSGGPADPRDELGGSSSRRTAVDNGARRRSSSADEIVVAKAGRGEARSLAGWPARPPRDEDTVVAPAAEATGVLAPVPSAPPAVDEPLGADTADRVEPAESWRLATAEELAAAIGLPAGAATTGPLPVLQRQGDPPTWVNRAIAPGPVTDPLEEPDIIATPDMETMAVPVLRALPPAGERPPLVRRVILARRNRPRVRKVSRVVRRVDAWSVFKISVLFWAAAYVILLVAGVLLWNLAYSTGTVSNVEGFIRNLFGLKKFAFDGKKIFHASYILGAFLAVAGTGLFVTIAVLFNLISDLVGGVRVTVLEEEVVLREREGARPVPRRLVDDVPPPPDNLSTP
jgi:Transmembrane domain of unknown function (DUF3566)